MTTQAEARVLEETAARQAQGRRDGLWMEADGIVVERALGRMVTPADWRTYDYAYTAAFREAVPHGE